MTLQDLSRKHRQELSIPVLAITGSNGKTTTKELMARVLSAKFRTRATVGNLNNHIGVPLTVLSITNTDEIAIVEMGANHIGEIKMLCDIAQPTHGLITNIGRAHLEGFGSLDGIKRGKSELYHALAGSDGIAFVNSDESFLPELSSHVRQRIIYCSGDPAQSSVDRMLYRAKAANNGCTVEFQDKEHRKWIGASNLFGQYNLSNIASAVVVGLFFEVPGSDICQAIATYEPQNNRSQTVVIGTNTCILDAYNANPSSMLAAIRSFGETAGIPKVLILGSMREMGPYSEEVHMEIALQALKIANARVILVGEEFQATAQDLGCTWYPDVTALNKEILANPPMHAHILMKGSRAMRLELLADSLKSSVSTSQ
jgi:UDP-N-acetylmuramoyl-tripeptide--D-alanyl-D-alanine ligase